MLESEKSVTFPFLIHRDDEAIQDEKQGIKEVHEETYETLKRLSRALKTWMGKEVDVLGFIKNGNFENALLRSFGEQNGIAHYVKLSKYVELYNVPKYSHIVEDAKELALLEPERIALYVGENPNDFTVPEISEKEVAEIVEKHSVYLYTEYQYQVYSLLKSLCEYLNYFNREEKKIIEWRVRDFAHYAKLDSYIDVSFSGYLLQKPTWKIVPEKFRNMPLA